jgi:glycosyltransferase A (GT-A) superfamily protein (DUF2064 family)
MSVAVRGSIFSVSTQLVVIAKAPVPGRVKTRLCPPCSPTQAAAVAAAALVDTLVVGDSVPVARRTLVLSGDYAVPPGWHAVPQRGGALGERLTSAFADTALPATATLLIGMDTPQVDAALLAAVVAPLGRADAVLAPAKDGGWWALALREPGFAAALRDVPTSRPDTGARTAAALRRAGLTVATAPVLSDVDTAADAWSVARSCPRGQFAAAVRAHVPMEVSR